MILTSLQALELPTSISLSFWSLWLTLNASTSVTEQTVITKFTLRQEPAEMPGRSAQRALF